MILRVLVSLPLVAFLSPALSPARQAKPATASASDSVSDSIVDGLRALRVDAKGDSPDAPGAPATLGQAIAAKPRVVVFGRCGYGSPEIAREEALVTHLACSSGATLVAIDVGYEEGLELDAYVQGGSDTARDARTVCADVGAWGAGGAPVELLDALRARNRDTKAPRVHIVGIGFGAAAPLTKRVQSFLGQVYPTTADRFSSMTSPLRQVASDGRSRYYKVDANDRFLARVAVSELAGILREQRAELEKLTTHEAYGIGMDAATALERLERALSFEVEGGPVDPRGDMMATSAVEALERAGESTRMLVLAHVRDAGRASDPDSFVARLKITASIEPLVIATAFRDGAFLSADPNAQGDRSLALRLVKLDAAGATPLETALARAADGRALFDVRKVPKEGPLAGWLAKPQLLRSARGALGDAREAPWDYLVSRDFDFLVFLDHARAADPAQPK